MSEQTDQPTASPSTGTLGFIGAGKMGGAIIRGLVASDIDVPQPIIAVTKSAESAAELNTLDGVEAAAVDAVPDAARTAAARADVLFLGVKPWLVHDVVRDIADVVRSGTIVVSIAGAVTTASIEKFLPAGIPVVRLNPNTPTGIRKGATVLSAGTTASPEHVRVVTHLLEAVGEVFQTAEEDLDVLSFITGGGPAYVFYFVEKFVGAAERLGFTKEEARHYVRTTVAGAASLLEHTDEDPGQLRRNVTSPNGITERAILAFEAHGWDQHFDEAATAYIERAHELAEEIDGEPA